MGANKSGRSLRALSAVISVRYLLLIDTLEILQGPANSAQEFSSLVTSGDYPHSGGG